MKDRRFDVNKAGEVGWKHTDQRDRQTLTCMWGVHKHGTSIPGFRDRRFDKTDEAMIENPPIAFQDLHKV